jgi:hypothetical protein
MKKEENTCKGFDEKPIRKEKRGKTLLYSMSFRGMT